MMSNKDMELLSYYCQILSLSAEQVMKKKVWRNRNSKNKSKNPFMRRTGKALTIPGSPKTKTNTWSGYRWKKEKNES